MPFIEISMYKGRSYDEKGEICSLLQKTIKEVYGIPHDNFHYRITEYDAADMRIPASCSKNYLLLEMDFFPGRKEREKNDLYGRLKDLFGPFGISAADLHVIIREPPLENWFLRGSTGRDIRNQRPL